MKTIARLLLGSALSLVASVSFAGVVPQMNVSIADASGKVVYRGKTDADGMLSTGKLRGGSYVVQFNSNDASVAGSSFALIAQAGREKTTANAVPGSQFTKGGVAMKLKVNDGMNISAYIAKADVAGGTGNAKFKIVDGRRYVWVPNAGIGSNMGGRWVEEGAASGLNAVGMSKDAMRAMRDNQTPHQEGWKGRGTN